MIECKVEPEMAVARFISRRPYHPTVDLTRDRVHNQAKNYRFSALVLGIVQSLPFREGREEKAS